MGGGNAKQRRAIRRMLRKLRGSTPIPELSGSSQTMVSETKTVWQRLIDFVEQPLFLWSLGILGGFVGLFIFTPLLIVCGICILLAFDRAMVVHGETSFVPNKNEQIQLQFSVRIAPTTRDRNSVVQHR
jgi:hypothetical protein